MRRLIALLLAVLFPMLSHAEEGDWGYAHINFVKANLTEKWSVLSRSQVTLRDDFSEFYFWFIDAGLAYAFTPAWRAEVAYRHAEWNFGDGWLEERRPMVNLDWFGAIRNTKINNRARLEYRNFTWAKKTDWRFRNRVRASFPWEVLGFSPFLEEELFIGANSGTLEMNWVTGGIQIKPLESLKLKLGYRWIAIRLGSDWENRNQLVTGLALFF